MKYRSTKYTQLHNVTSIVLLFEKVKNKLLKGYIKELMRNCIYCLKTETITIIKKCDNKLSLENTIIPTDQGLFKTETNQ